MTKPRIILIASGALLVFAVVFAVIAIMRTPDAAEIETPSDETGGALPATGDPNQDFENFLKIQESKRAAAPQGERIEIQGTDGIVTVRNFYPESFFTLGSDEVALDQGQSYTISYRQSTQAFTIIDYAISTEEYLEIRPRAEAAFLAILDISRADACRLAVSHLVPPSPEQAGIEASIFPFSGCAR